MERAIEEAEKLRLDDPLSLADLLARYPGRRGAATIRAILDGGAVGTTSSGYCSVVTFLNIVVKVSPNPRTGSRKPAIGQASLSVVLGSGSPAVTEDRASERGVGGTTRSIGGVG